MANFLYISVGFTLVATLFLFSSTDALKCYSCSNSQFCNDENLDLSKAFNITCPDNTPACAKVTGNVVGDSDTVVTFRGCVSNNPAYCDTLGSKVNVTRIAEDGKIDLVTAEDLDCNTCSGDLCNSGNMAGTSAAAILLTAAIAKLLSH